MLIWFATRHPYMAGSIVGVLLVLTVAVARWAVRALRSLFRGAGAALTNPSSSI
jgi:hypothetical protein